MKKFLWGILFFFPFLLCAQTDEHLALKQKEIQALEQQLAEKKDELSELKLEQIRKNLKSVGYPKSPYKGEVVEHSAMVLEYIEKHEQASWVYHIISPDIITGNEGRTNVFMNDSLVSTGSATERDYFIKETTTDGETKYDGFGYDRGHLAPSADFRWNPKALAESYYYSNISPQLANFNRGTWADVESLLRKYIYNSGNELYVVTGGILKDDLPKVSRSINNVTIPEYYYKVAIDPKAMKAIAFLVPNINDLKEAEAYVTSINEVEKLTGISFFTNFAGKEAVINNNDLSFFLNSDYLKSEFKPLDPTKLPRKTFNTTQAKLYMGKSDLITVCGTVAGKFTSKKGNVFLNLDKPFPNTIFSVFIKGEDLVNFSFDPAKDLFKQCICITGVVDNFRETPTISVKKQEQIRFYTP